MNQKTFSVSKSNSPTCKNKENRVYVTSLNYKSKFDYDTAVGEAANECVYAILWNINPDIDYLLKEGAVNHITENVNMPYLITKTFSLDENLGNEFVITYQEQYSTRYFNFLVENYGIEKVIELVKFNDYENIIGKTWMEVNEEFMK